jgi:acyl-CoA thioester hydrolase
MAADGAGAALHTHREKVAYYQVDQQGVVFNMWYLGFLDEAFNAMLERRGLPYPAMLAAGFDVQLVHTEIDWEGSLRQGDLVDVDVSLEGRGTSSFTLGFRLRRGDTQVATARTVYVAVSAEGSGSRPIPPALAAVLGLAG